MCFVFFFLKINYTQNTLDNFVIYSNRIGTCVLLTQYRYFNLKYRNYRYIATRPNYQQPNKLVHPIIFNSFTSVVTSHRPYFYFLS